MTTKSFYPDFASDGVWFDKSDPDQIGFANTMVWLGNDGYDNCLALLFRSINIPQGATINAAKLRITAYADDANVSANVNIFFNAADSPVLPQTYAEALALVKTNAVEWSNIAAWTDTVVYESPDLKGILQEIVSRAGYVQGGNIIVIIENNNSDAMAVRTGFFAETEGPPL